MKYSYRLFFYFKQLITNYITHHILISGIPRKKTKYEIGVYAKPILISLAKL